MNTEQAIAKFGAAALSDKNGKVLSGNLLANRIAKLQGEIDNQKATDAKAFDAPGTKANPLPTTQEPTAPATSGAAAFAESRVKFAIEKNVPMPERNRATGPRENVKYPFAKMAEVGDSFFVPATEEMPKPWKTLSSLGSRMGKQLGNGINFTAVRIAAKDGMPEGCRVFRVADLTEPKPPRKKKAAPAA